MKIKYATNKFSIFIAVIFIVVLLASCQSLIVKAGKERMPAGSSVAILSDSSKDINNMIVTTFMKQGYTVKAFSLTDIDNSSKKSKATSYQPYEDEAIRALTLKKIRREFRANYLVILSLDGKSSPFVRVVDLQSMSIVFLHVYAGNKDALSVFLEELTGAVPEKK
jgi:hypothetical protein